MLNGKPTIIELVKARLLERFLKDRNAQKADLESTLVKQFKFYDIKDRGIIGKTYFLQALNNVGVFLSNSEQKQLMDHLSKSEVGVVNYNDFILAL